MTRFHSSHVTRSSLTADLRSDFTSHQIRLHDRAVRMNCLYLLLFLCLLNYRVTSTELVIEQRGGYVILPCDYEESEIAEIGFSRSENSTVCWNKECESDRIFKKENHDIVIKNLSFSDAGKYILRCSYINNQSELEQQNRTYQLHIHDEVSVKIGEELKLDVLLPNTDKVQHQGRRSTGWKEDWSRTDGVQSERLTIRDGNLIISNFTARDAGTYEVLDPEGNILIMVKVSVSSTVSSTELESKGKLNYTGYDKPNDTKQQRTTAVPVKGEKGGKVTLPCEYETNTIFHTDLISESEDTSVCQTEQCMCRVFKQGNCDIVIKNLSFSDAGKYILRVYYRNDQGVLERQTQEYKLQILDSISVKTGEELKMDVLLPNADKVEANSGGEWRKVWKRGHRVWREQMIDSDGNQIIKVFKANDAGTYRVLDSEGNILITVTVTDNTDKGETDDTQQSQKWILSVGVCLGILALAVIVTTVIIWQRRQRDYIQVQGQENTELPELLVGNHNDLS